MHVPHAKTARASAWIHVGKRFAVSLGLLVAAVATLVLVPGRFATGAAALMAAGAFATWLSALMLDALVAGHGGRATKRRRRRPVRRKRVPVVTLGARDDPRIQPGDYFSTGRRLYRVEHLAGARVLVEDCRSGELVDMDRETCASLKRVKRAADDGAPRP